MADNDDLPEMFRQPAGWQWGTMENARHVQLRTGGVAPDGPAKAHVVYVEGLSESAEKTFELAHDFNKHACGFWVYDRRGQGLSGRYLKDKFKQHSQGFENDADDLIQFVKTVVPHDGVPVIVLGHSTGGMVALLAAGREPALFSGLVLTAPLMGIKDRLVKNKEGLWAHVPMPGALKNISTSRDGKWRSRTDPKAENAQDVYTSDPERMKVHDWWMEHNEALRVGRPTYGWLREACRAIEKLRAPGKLESMKVPVLLYLAGDDRLTNEAQAGLMVTRLPDVMCRRFAKGKHELFMETDDIRSTILNDVFDFIGKCAGKRLPEPKP